MDVTWSQIVFQALVTLVATLVGVLVPLLPAVILAAIKYGELNQRQKSHEEKCEGECDRQRHEHSRLFERVDEHGEAIAGLNSEVKGLGHRVGRLEKAEA